MDDMIGNGAEALSLFAEHAALPEPRSLEQIRSDADVRADLAEGAFLVAVPSGKSFLGCGTIRVMVPLPNL